jgi:hypothetical protein
MPLKWSEYHRMWVEDGDEKEAIEGENPDEMIAVVIS